MKLSYILSTIALTSGILAAPIEIDTRDLDNTLSSRLVNDTVTPATTIDATLSDLEKTTIQQISSINSAVSALNNNDAAGVDVANWINGNITLLLASIQNATKSLNAATGSGAHNLASAASTINQTEADAMTAIMQRLQAIITGFHSTLQMGYTSLSPATQLLVRNQLYRLQTAASTLVAPVASYAGFLQRYAPELGLVVGDMTDALSGLTVVVHRLLTGPITSSSS